MLRTEDLSIHRSSHGLERSEPVTTPRKVSITISGPGISVSHTLTSPGYNTTPLPHHMIGLHLGTPVAVLHCRDRSETIHMFRPGDVIFTPAGSPVDYAHAEWVDALYITLDPPRLDELAMQMGLDEAQSVLYDNFGTPDATIHRIGQELLRELAVPGFSETLYIEALTIQLMIHLMRRYSRAGLAREVPPENQRVDLATRLRPALEYIHAHLSDALSLHDLAATVHLTPYHFSRLFKRAYGLSPHQYVIQQRVEAAQQLLKNPRLTVAEVALMVGFADHSHLIRHYKRLMGYTPRA